MFLGRPHDVTVRQVKTKNYVISKKEEAMNIMSRHSARLSTHSHLTIEATSISARTLNRTRGFRYYLLLEEYRAKVETSKLLFIYR